jgi:hypothetical protein
METVRCFRLIFVDVSEGYDSRTALYVRWRTDKRRHAAMRQGGAMYCYAPVCAPMYATVPTTNAWVISLPRRLRIVRELSCEEFSMVLRARRRGIILFRSLSSM